MYSDDTAVYMFHKSLSELIINFKKEKTEAMLFGTAKRLHSKSDLKTWTQGRTGRLGNSGECPKGCLETSMALGQNGKRRPPASDASKKFEDLVINHGKLLRN